MESTQSLFREEDDEDIFKILIATDIHLGYAEDDPVRGPDTFDTLDEILQIGETEQVDFVLLGGDLFHHAQPSPYSLYKCMDIFKKYCLGDRPVSVEFLSDPSHNFSQNLNPTVNYEDPNLNVALPIFSIHGNHDDPTGQKHVSALDLLSTSGLINYFGRWNSLDHVEISPILLKKGKTKLALYGLSHIRDERLGRLFLDNKVKMLSPDDGNEWFHLLVWHQNRVARGSKNFIPDSILPKFLNLVIWGHEHDCRIEKETQVNGVNISQPGSSVATSLTAGESIPKKVGILKICKNKFEMRPVELKTVRPFKYDEIVLKDIDEISADDDNTESASELSKQLVASKINSMITEAKRMGHSKKVSDKPLIRLVVKYKSESQVFNTIRFGQSYVDKVANPESMVKFQILKIPVRRKQAQNQEEEEGPVLADRVEDIVTQYFTEKESLSMFALNSISEAVKKFIDANDNNAISDVADNFIKETLKHLDKELPDVENTENVISDFKENMERESENFVNNILNDPKRNKGKAAKTKNADDDDAIILDDGSDDGGNTSHVNVKKPSTRGKGTTTKTRATRATKDGRGRGGAKNLWKKN